MQENHQSEKTCQNKTGYPTVLRFHESLLPSNGEARSRVPRKALLLQYNAPWVGGEAVPLHRLVTPKIRQLQRLVTAGYVTLKGQWASRIHAEGKKPHEIYIRPGV